MAKQIHPPIEPMNKPKGVTKEGRVLLAIKNSRRGVTNWELSKIALKYTSVISELRKDGHNIIAERQLLPNGKASNTWKYFLGADL